MGTSRPHRIWFFKTNCLALGLLAVGVFAADLSIARAQTPEPIAAAPSPRRAGEPRKLAPTASEVSRVQRLPPVESPIKTVRFVEPAQQVDPRVTRAVDRQPVKPAAMRQKLDVVAEKADEPAGFPIDLPTALRLADAENLQVAFAREQVVQAMARVDAADVLWLPSLRGGVSYNRHDGSIQAVAGDQFNTSRGAFYAGAGAGAFGAASPAVPGLYANFHLVDALFQPLAARQFAGSRNRAASAVTNDTLLQVTLAYFELLRAGQEIAIARAVRSDARQLVEVTAAYADTGSGLRSDANRAKAELALRTNEVQRALEAQRVASARLAQLLRLDPTVTLDPTEPAVVAVDVVALDVPLKELVAEGLSQRPELAEHRLLVAEAVQRLRRERLAVLVPSIVMGASYGGMGAGINGNLAPTAGRLDVDAVAYWEMRNLGFGEAAARRGAQSSLCATQIRQMAMLDQVAREIVEAHAQVQSRKGQMATARTGIEAALASQQQNLERIEQAKGLPIEVLQSIQALAQARREYLRTLIDYNAAQFTLYRALGWPAKMPDEPAVPAVQ
jgi:outer membrane protein TolC